MFNAWIIGILGVWVFIAPFTDMTPVAHAWSHWIVGAVAAVLGFSMMRRHPTAGVVAGAAGAWLFIAGFIDPLLYGTGVFWNNVIVGAVMAAFGFAAVSGRRANPVSGAGT